MPDGRSKNEILATLANNNTVSDEWKVRCVFAMSKPKAEAGEDPNSLFDMQDYLIKNNLAEPIKKLAQNEILDPNFRAQCILAIPASREKISSAENLLKKQASCDLYYQAQLVLILQEGPFKQKISIRLAKEESLNRDLRNLLIVQIPPGKKQDELWLNLIQSLTPSLSQKVAAAAFIQNPTQRNNNLMHLYDKNLDNLEAISNCALLMDPGKEKTERINAVKEMPRGKEYLDKAYAIFHKRYPFIKNPDSLGIKAKIAALYPGCIQE